MAKIDNSAYNYFLQAYGDKLSGTRFDSHKREDLEKSTTASFERTAPLLSTRLPLTAM